MTEFEIINDILLESPHEHKFKSVSSICLAHGAGYLGYCCECTTFMRTTTTHRSAPIEVEYIDKNHESYEYCKKLLDSK